MHILSTGQLEPALIARAAAAGVTLDCIDFTRIAYKSDDILNAELSVLSDKTLMAVFTSAHAVKAVSTAIAAPSLWQIASLNGATRKAILNHWPLSRLVYEGSDASELGRALIMSESNIPFYFFCGNRRRDELPRLFRTSGRLLNEIVVYETVLTPFLIKQHYGGILFFSPGAVESFFKTNKTVTEKTVLFAIGATTAAAVKAYTSAPVVMSDRHSREAVLQKMITYFENEK